MSRYIFIVSGERSDRENNLEILMEQLQSYGGSIIKVRPSTFGKTKNTKFRYALHILDSRTAPGMINWQKFSLPRVQDKKLYERIKKGFSVEDYVMNLYER